VGIISLFPYPEGLERAFLKAKPSRVQHDSAYEGVSCLLVSLSSQKDRENEHPTGTNAARREQMLRASLVGVAPSPLKNSRSTAAQSGANELSNEP
jgi:hypothetical protein